MRSFFTAALVGTVAASPYGVSDYIRPGIGAAPGPSSNSSSSTIITGNATTSKEPCATVAQSLARSNTTTVNSTLAYECLQSVPLDIEGDRLQLEGLKTFTQFQSTLAYLKDPPQGYLYPAVDIEGALDEISEKLENNGYRGEYDFQMDLSRIIASAYDGHFAYQADITRVFAFQRTNDLYSWSTDGLALPEIYLDIDLVTLIKARNASNSTISPVAKINGQEVEGWLNSYATLVGGSQDPDANYNALFPAVPGSPNLFLASSQYQGPYTSVTFRNGTSRIISHISTTKADFSNITSGSDFFDQFCTGPSGSEDQTPTAVGTAIPTTEVPFQAVPSQTASPGASVLFPKPYIAMDDNSIAGYFPEANKDLAILAISSFSPTPDGTPAFTQFANVVREFLATAQKLGKKKLAIDLRGNGGGEVPLAFDLVAQLFPKITPYGATNFRATPLLNDVGSIVSQFYSNVTNVTVGDSVGCGSDFSTPFNFREELNADDKPFKSWKEVYGPRTYHGDNFTNLVRYNLNDKYSVDCSNVSNYGNITKITPQVFNPEDVILIQDGYCASTCAVFSEFMKAQAKVKQVVFGGRKQTGPMQAVGGVKGANVYKFDAILSFISEAGLNDTTPAQKKAFVNKYGNLTDGANQAIKRAAVGSDGLVASVNVRNNIRMGDSSVTPLQFVYEAADCRFFYTAQMLLKQDLVWDAAYKAIWGTGACVYGSTGHPSSQGLGVGYAPPANAKNFFGAKVLSAFPEDLDDDGMSAMQDKRKKPKYRSNNTNANGTQTNDAGPGTKRWNVAVLGSAVICSVLAALL